MNLKKLSFFTIFLCLSSLSCYGQLTASFTPTISAGCPTIVVTFNNTSANATSYSWNLANGGPPFTQTSPTASYSTPGTYTIILTAYNGSSSTTASATITVYPLPTVSFTANDTLICPGDAVSFINTSTPGTSGPATYNWNFGDGTSSPSQNPIHPYQTSNSYTITLTVTNSQGCSNTLTKNAYIDVATPPVANFTAPNTFFCGAPSAVAFTNASTGTATLTNFTWSFGDNLTSLQTNPTHNYLSGGVFSVRLIATDANGCKDTIVKPNYITIDQLQGTIQLPDTVCALQTLTFDATSNATNPSYTWDFGDGYTGAFIPSYHSYNNSGSDTVKLYITDGVCNDTVKKKIYVRPNPSISFTYTPLHPCPSPVTVNFTSTAPAGSSYHWSFGDGDTSALANPSHIYTQNQFAADATGGYDSVLLTVTDAHGCVNTTLDTVMVYDIINLVKNGNPSAIHTGDPSGCEPLTLHFVDSSLTDIPTCLVCPSYPYPYAITSYHWNFGDGSPTTTQVSPTHTFTTTGIHTATISVTTIYGCIKTDTFQVSVGTKPIITSFTSDKTHMCFSDSITFTAHATGDTPLYYLFIPGDTNYVLHEPFYFYVFDTSYRYFYHKPGLYHAQVVVGNYGCPSDTSSITVIVDSPSVSFSYNVTCHPRTKVHLNDTAIGATSILWLFGDGDTSTQHKPFHTYPSLGYWSPTIVAYNSRSGCTDTFRPPNAIRLFDLNPRFNDTIVCKNTTLDIQPILDSGPQIPSLLYWYVNNAIMVLECNGNPNPPPPSCIIPPVPVTNFIYTYDTVEQYHITLILEDSLLCYDTVQRIITAALPIDSFTVSPHLGCLPQTVIFADQSHYVTGTHYASSVWDFGDGHTLASTNPNSSHIYDTAGQFEVKEIVTDNIGCVDSVSYPAIVIIDKPHALFGVQTQYPCIGDSVHFTNLSYSDIAYVHWAFGTGDTSALLNPAYAYLNTGIFTVSLRVIDSFGCKDTLTQNAYINVTKPHAAFTMNDSTGVCPPLNVSFTNHSTNASSYFWNFGNNNTSVSVNPVNPYTVPGQNTVMLVAINSHGCKDTTYGHTILYGYAGSLSYSPLLGCPPMLVNFSTNVLNVPFLQWDFSDGVVSAASPNTSSSHTYYTAGAYVPKLILSDSAGCHVSSTGLDTIKVDSIAARFVFSPAFVCIHDPVSLRDTSKSLFSYPSAWQWLFSNGAPGNTSNTSHTFDTAGTAHITLIVTDAIGCKDTVTDSITVYPLPIVTATGDTVICLGDAASIAAGGAVSYSWSPSSTLSCDTCRYTKASATSLTVYIVTGTDAQGCKNTDSVTIGIKTNIQTSAGPGGAICIGQSYALSDTGGLNYAWYPAASLDNSQVATPVAAPKATTTYMVIAKTGSCLPDTNYVTVTVHQLPQVNAGTDQTIVAGNTCSLDARTSGSLRFTWSPSSALDCDSCVNPLVHIDQTTTFTLIAYSQFGCIDSSHVTINVICDHKQVFVPNTFTPNGDGENDLFFPRGVGLKIIKAFRVYDRWGGLVFDKHDINLNDESTAWDGSYLGGKPRPDVYVYTIDAICETGEAISWKGDVTIIR